MIEQSLCHHLQAQLTEYYRLIAVLESQMAMSAPASGTTSSQGQGQGQVDGNGVTTGQPGAQSDGMSLQAQESGLTLRRLDVWINEWRLRLRMMSVCVEGAKGTHKIPILNTLHSPNQSKIESNFTPPETHGGALVNLIHGYTSTGDPFVRTFTDQLLEDVSTPFFASLHRWLFAGELYDPFREFFVAVDPELESVQYSVPMHGSGTGHGHMSSDMGFGGDVGDVTGEGEGAFRLWENKYQFIKEMLPAFVSESFGRKVEHMQQPCLGVAVPDLNSQIFSTGKSLNFIRYSCHDSDWVATRDKVGNTGGSK
jgi:gamma-tubulin complex component 3